MRTIISVHDKTGIIVFAQELQKLGFEIISTGGTAKALSAADVTVQAIDDITNFPEIMDGRVKTLHPKIFGGILGKRDKHQAEAEQHQIPWIDLVICNLYPFAKVVKDPHADLDTILENIDIGGNSLIRAAAKNYPWVAIVIDHNDYPLVLNELQTTKTISEKTRRKLATKAFAHCAQYDSLIANYLENADFPQTLTLAYEKYADLRYGENPHQSACVYQQHGKDSNLLAAKQHQGKQLSFNNLLDANAALTCLSEFTEPTCVIIKHANPCGVATTSTIDLAFINAWDADAKSAFGGIVALNAQCTAAIAEQLQKVFIEIILAPSYASEALEILKSKPNLRVLEFTTQQNPPNYTIKPITNGMLIQSANLKTIEPQDLQFVTKLHPSAAEISALLFAWKIAKHAKSNAIVIASQNSSSSYSSVGIGQGQVSRVDAVDIALRKADKKLAGSVLASDGFFPFADSIDLLANTGIKAIIQPGGSIKDKEVIAACEQHGIAMVFTGIRNFNH
jgi:phosphoribosylaminoimidazolecarboxamide formyltransferase/IMP cyclohydrolase